MIITYKDLRDSDVTPRVHGNGFIQVDLLEKDCRLHIWPEPKLETQKVYTGIHNHNFSFTSKILLGTLLHIEYEGVKQSISGFHHVYKTIPRDREDKGLILASPHRYNLGKSRWFWLGQGSQYDFEYGKFHDSKGLGLTATLMRKKKVEPLTEVYVLCNYNEVPDNDFNRYQYTPEALWPIIEDVFNKIKEIDTTYV